MSPGRGDWDLRLLEADIPARSEDIDSGVDVPIMSNTALAAHPLSYSEVCDTFRAADCAAARTHLGCPSFVNLKVLGPVPYGFVAELTTKLRPACIEHGFGEAGTSQSGGVHIPDYNKSVLTNKAVG